MSTSTAFAIAPQEPATEETAIGDGLTRIYRARTIEELIPKIQAELGADAIVVRRQQGLSGGIAGFFQRPFVEIEAKAGAPGVDLYDEDGAAPALPAAIEQLPVPAPARGLGAYARIQRAAPTEDSPVSMPAQADDPFAAALAEAEAAVLTAKFPTPEPPAAPSTASAAETHTPPKASPPAARGRARAKIEDSLLGFGMGEALVRELIETAAAHVLPLMPARSSLSSAVRKTLAQRIPSLPPLPVGSATIALVGPGGSGKTACCAALLEAYRERSTLPAACVTVLPGGARGELQALLSPHILEPAPIDGPQFTEALRKTREEGLLLLDLPSLSPADRGSIRACAGLLESIAPDRVILALPATIGAKPATQMLEALAPLRPSALAITHADETDQLGVAVESACGFGLAPEYLLDRAHGGLTQIDPDYLAERLLP